MSARHAFLCRVSDEHCITCSDAAVAMRLLLWDPSASLGICADEHGMQMEVLLGLIEEPQVGDTLLVHAGTAILRIASVQAGLE